MNRKELYMIRNLRDLGGIVNSEGKKIKKGLFFRSAKLCEIDAADLKWFADNNITRIIDLRTVGEVMRSPDVIIPGTEYVNWYLQDDNNEEERVNFKKVFEKCFAPGNDDEKIALMPDMTEIYRNMVNGEFASRRFSELIRGIVSYDKGAVLFHCTSGKDRTGMTAAAICCILGVDRGTIYDDYLISRAHAEWEAARMRRDFKEMGASDRLADTLMQLFTLDRRYLDAFFDEIEKLYGSIDSYMYESLKLTDDEIKTFRERVLL